MSETLIRVIRDTPGIVVVRLNRPDKRNALNVPLMTALCDGFEVLNDDESVRVIVLAGDGPVFCAGLDLAEAQDATGAHQSAELIARILLTVHASRAATIAAVHGAAVAGGAGLMTACDLVVAAEDTKIGYPEVRRGLVAGLVTTLLRRQVSDRVTRELLILGELVDARTAQTMSLVNRVVAEQDLMPTALELGASVLKGAPGAVKRSRELLDTLWPTSLEDDLMQAMKWHNEVRASDEALEGMRAFTEKRLPKWDPDTRT